jgi:hypothetical protein
MAEPARPAGAAAAREAGVAIAGVLLGVPAASAAAIAGLTIGGGVGSAVLAYGAVGATTLLAAAAPWRRAVLACLPAVLPSARLLGR